MNQNGVGNKEGRQIIWQRTPKHRISPICLHLNRLERGEDNAAHQRLQSSKTSRGSNLDPELCIFVKIFKFYLVDKTLYVHMVLLRRNMSTGLMLNLTLINREIFCLLLKLLKVTVKSMTSGPKNLG
jgi:hypothetical protein